MVKYRNLTRLAIRQLLPGQSITEHGITCEHRLTKNNKSDRRYTLNIMVEGERIHRVVGHQSDGTTRTQAEEYIAKLKRDAKDARLNLPTGTKIALRFNQAADDYISRLKTEGGKDIKRKEQRLKDHLKPWFKGTPLTKIDNALVKRYRSHRRHQHASPATINRELAVLSQLLTLAVEWKWLNKRIRFDRETEPEGRKIFLTVDQLARLIESARRDANKHIYLFILIGLDTSMRYSNIVSIRKEHIDIERRVIWLPHTKSGKREQPITRQLAEVLEPYQGKGWLFPSKKSETGHTVNVAKAFRRAVVGAGLDPVQVTPHTLRHTAITHLVQAGIDLPTVQRISGHKTMKMLLNYAHQDSDHIQAAMDKLESRYSPDTITPELQKQSSEES